MNFFIVILVSLFLAPVAFAADMNSASVNTAMNVSEDSLRTFVVDDVEVEIGDAFNDSRAHTFLDSALYSFMNIIHIETHESVIRKLLLFEPGDTVSQYQLIESERYLRKQYYISDAKITTELRDGKNVAKVKTSDNWTLSIPISLDRPGDEWVYGIGLQENNFLGFGQTVGIYYSHDELRDMYQGLYENSNFLFRHNHLKALYSHNTDGYMAFGQMNLPYLSRSKNQWAYTLEGLRSESDLNFYASGNRPFGSAKIDPTDYIEIKDSCDKALPHTCATKPEYAKDTLRGRVDELNNGDHALKVMTMKRVREDSLSLRLGRSFGSPTYKLYLTGSYDYHDFGNDYSSVNRYMFEDGGEVYAIDESALDSWIPVYRDSRFGVAAEFSRIRYDRLVNYKNVKWVEDVDRGYSVKAKLSKNSESLGASDNDWRLDYKIALALGTGVNHFGLGTYSFFYFDEDARRDIYEKIQMEYIFKPSRRYSTVFEGQMDTYKRAALGRQLTLGGLSGMNLPTSIFAGQARFYANLEQRFFPDIEIGTVVPVFTAFVSAGETTESFDKFEPRDLQYLVGLGVRFGMTKSIMRTVNHINLSWPVHGPIKKGWMPRLSVLGKVNL